MLSSRTRRFFAAPTTHALLAALLTATSVAQAQQTTGSTPPPAATTHCIDPATIAAMQQCGPPASSQDLQLANERVQRLRTVLSSNPSSRAMRRQQAANPIAHRAFSDDETALDDALALLSCHDPDLSLRRTARHRRATLHYRANHFEAAATLFSQVLTLDPSAPDPEGLRLLAAEIQLDALRLILMQSPGRWNVCLPTLSNAIADGQRELCSGLPGSASASVCARLAPLRCRLLRQQADVELSAGQHLQAAQHYEALVQQNLQCGQGTQRVDELLHNAATEFDAADRRLDAVRVRTTLVQQFSTTQSPLVFRALWSLAEHARAIGDHDTALLHYERFAREGTQQRDALARTLPTADESLFEAHRQAAVLRIAQHDGDAAIAWINNVVTLFSAVPDRRREVLGMLLSVTQSHEDRAAALAQQTPTTPARRAQRDAAVRAVWLAAVTHRERTLALVQTAGLDLLIRARVSLARARWNAGQRAQALALYRDAASDWGTDDPHRQLDESTGAVRLRAIQDPREPFEARLSATLDAVAEARFRLAMEHHDRFMAMRLPRFTGGNNQHAYNQWSQQVLTPAVQRHRDLLEDEATEAFRSVLALHVPRWELAATVRLSELFLVMGTRIRTAPVPPDVRRDPALLQTFQTMVDERASAIENTGRVGLQRCIERAQQYHWFDETITDCQQQLARITPARRIPDAHELLPDGALVHSAPAPSAIANDPRQTATTVASP